MSHRGNWSENARAESFGSALKIELVYRHDFQDHDHARRVVFEWIETFYNRRRNSSIGYLSPVDLENHDNCKTTRFAPSPLFEGNPTGNAVAAIFTLKCGTSIWAWSQTDLYSLP
jgi:hypothetical protein